MDIISDVTGPWMWLRGSDASAHGADHLEAFTTAGSTRYFSGLVCPILWQLDNAEYRRCHFSKPISEGVY